MLDENSPVVRWLDHVDRLWPVVAGTACFIFFLSGRLEDSATKLRRIQAETDPIAADLLRVEAAYHRLAEDLARHKELGAHAVMESRMQSVERELAEIRRKVQ